MITAQRQVSMLHQQLGLWVSLMMLPVAATANTFALSTSTGTGDGAERYTLGGQWLKPWRETNTGALLWSLDLDGSYWIGHHDSLVQLSLVPGLVYQGNNAGLKPIAYAGIGPAWISQTRLDSRELSTQFQFNSRIGVGMMTGRHSLALEAWHLSNAGLKRPNDGLTSYGLSYRYRFD